MLSVPVAGFYLSVYLLGIYLCSFYAEGFESSPLELSLDLLLTTSFCITDAASLSYCLITIDVVYELY